MNGVPQDLVAEYGLEACVLARIEVELELAAAAGLEGQPLEDHLAFFVSGLLKSLPESSDGAD